MSPFISIRVLSVLTALVLVGCGSGDKAATGAKEAARPAAADRAIARASALKLEDLPSGWKASSRTTSNAFDCLPFNRMREQAYVEAPDLQRDGAFVRNGVAIFPAADEAEQVLEGAGTDATLECVAEAVRDSATRGARHLEIGAVSATRLDDPQIGVRSTAIRVTVPIEASGTHVDVTADYVYVLAGRGLSVLILGRSGLSPDAGLRMELTHRVTERLEGALRAEA